MLARQVILPELGALCFHNSTNPFSSNSFLFTSIQIPRGVTLSTFRLSDAPSASRITYPTLRRANPFVYNGLPPLWVSWPSFASPDPLFSIVCSLFCQNVGGWGIYLLLPTFRSVFALQDSSNPLSHPLRQYREPIAPTSSPRHHCQDAPNRIFVRRPSPSG